MGCTPSITNRQIKKLAIMAPQLLKNPDLQFKDLLTSHHVNFQEYLTLDSFIEDFQTQYIHDILVSEGKLNAMKQFLKQLGLAPNLYVLDKKGVSSENVYYVDNFEDLISKLQSNNEFIKTPCSTNQKISLVILRSKKNTKEFKNLEQILISKNIQYELFSCMRELIHWLINKQPYFLVTEFMFHEEVLRITESRNIRVISYCTFKEQIYNPKLYFYSDNFMEIANQVASQLEDIKVEHVKCSIIFVFSPGFEDIRNIQQALQGSGLQIKFINDIDEISKYSKMLFSMTLMVKAQHVKIIQKRLEEINYRDRAKIISLNKNQYTQIELRKQIKQAKKGYKIIKTTTKSIDIIDKHHVKEAFVKIKLELEKENIRVFSYTGLEQYSKKNRNCSPFVICNYEQKFRLHDYLEKQKQISKIIIYCSKDKIDNDDLQSAKWVFTAWNFIKIMKFLKQQTVPYPKLETEKKINDVLKKINKQNKRISIQKWCSLGTPEDEKNADFINVDASTNHAQIIQMQKNAASLWALDYSPLNAINKFKSDLIDSLKKLNKYYKLQCKSQILNGLVQSIKAKTLYEIILDTRMFFQSFNQIGLRINNSLMDLESLEGEVIKQLRQIMIVLSLNFMTFCKQPLLQKTKLYCWTKSKFLSQCEIGSIVYPKKFLIFFEQNGSKDKMTQYKIQIQLNCDLVNESNMHLNNFFEYKNKYIFCPYTRFVLTGKIAPQFNKEGVTIYRLQYEKQTQYVKQIVETNICSESALENKYEQLVNCEDFIDPQHLNQKISTKNYLKALALIKVEKYQESKQMLEDALSLHYKSSVVDSRMTIEMLYRISCIHSKMNNTSLAIKNLQEILQCDPDETIKQLVNAQLARLQPHKQLSIKQDEQESEQDQQGPLTVINLQERGNRMRSNPKIVCLQIESKQNIMEFRSGLKL